MRFHLIAPYQAVAKGTGTSATPRPEKQITFLCIQRRIGAAPAFNRLNSLEIDLECDAILVTMGAVGNGVSDGLPEHSDPELMRQLARGSMASLGRLVQRHQGRVRALAYRMTGRWDAADDIAQDAFLRLYHAARRYRPTAEFSTWLYRIVINLCLDRAKRRQLPGLIGEPAADRTTLPEDSLVRREVAEAVQREIEHLPERQRVALILHRFENLTHSQIAAVTGWSESSIESLLVRAYAQLRTRLKTWADS